MNGHSFRARPVPARLAFVIVSIVFLADQFTKWMVLRAFVPGESLPLIPSILHLTYVQNTGAAFGLLKDRTSAFIALSIAVSVWILWELFRNRPQGALRLWGLALVLAGALGNLVDRVRLGYVVDMIDLRIWPVFNVADSAITIGVGLLLFATFQISGSSRASRAGPNNTAE